VPSKFPERPAFLDVRCQPSFLRLVIYAQQTVESLIARLGECKARREVLPAVIEGDKQMKRSIGFVVSPRIDLQLSSTLTRDCLGARFAFRNLTGVSQPLKNFRDERLP
jgi:hypothetical protein